MVDYRRCALALRQLFERQARQLAGRGAFEQTARGLLVLEGLVAADCCFDKKGYPNTARLAAFERKKYSTLMWTAWWWKAVVERTVEWAWCLRYGKVEVASRRIVPVGTRREAFFGPGAGALQFAFALAQRAVGTIRAAARRSRR